ncbi:H(+)/Cl(-) exchange transporter 3 [Trametes pubescens]|uniref:H(+)/Cl(-) exchange transporter 3 n=1 Tax=Trametes pubescens TaxID=154538 RepID=A0A1M2VQE3_TRAPU|nr:H(+)/Cl(-) exchange transporter 3 [Trametes pubescens]
MFKPRDASPAAGDRPLSAFTVTPRRPRSHSTPRDGSSNTQLPWFSTSKDTPREEDVRDAEAYEFVEHGEPLPAQPPGKPVAYEEGSTIDWLREEAAERERKRVIGQQRGLRGLLSLMQDSVGMWVVIVLTGMGTGVVGAWLDVLVRWLGDLREGRCTYGFFYNQVACCSGLDPGEKCNEWQSWSEYLSVDSIFAQSLLQSAIYIALSIAFAGSSAILVKSYAPYAFHTGIPEIKAVARKRRLLAAAAAAGVSVAFGSPLGGVLFGLEELDAFFDDGDVMWRGFVTSVIAAVSLQYIDPFGTSKLVLFQVTESRSVWRAFELIPWVFLSVVGGLLGSLLIKLNTAAAVYRRHSILHDWPIVEVVAFTAITAAVSYPMVFMRVQSSELVANLFQECDVAKGDYHGLCNPSAIWANVFLLTLTALAKVGFTAWTFGMMVPAGIFLPTITIGASLGRAVGLITQGLHRAYPTAWLFASCPPDPTVRCVSPGFYAVIGASAMLGGVTRMTISLVVILFELTGALSHVLPIMISVMVSKWVADAFGKDGIYSTWIAMRQYPWLPAREFRDDGQTAAHVMKGAANLVVVHDDALLGVLDELARMHAFRGFPVVRGDQLLGFVLRDKLRAAIDAIFAENPAGDRRCTFVPPSHAAEGDSSVLNLSSLLEEAVLQLRKDVPLELVVNMFQKLNLRHILFSDGGKLTGMVTKTDVVWLLTAQASHAGALAEDRR